MNRNICRVCLKKGMLTSLFSEDKFSPYLMIMECTTVKITKEDSLPPLICQDCLNNLKIAIQFKRQCEASDQQLRAYDTTVGITEEYSEGNATRHKETKGTKEILEKVKLKKSKVLESCDECGKQFPYSGYLRIHLRSHTGEAPHVCQVCGKKFKQKGNLVLHSRIHTGEKPFQCEVCSKQFSTSSNLRAHGSTHGGRPYHCHQCNKTYSTRRLLQSHQGTHTGIKNHACKLCGKDFYKASYLRGHVNTVHKGEKNFVCIECGKLFSNASNLIVHYRIHSGEKPFVCEFCKASFNQSSSLRRHKKQHVIHKDHPT